MVLLGAGGDLVDIREVVGGEGEIGLDGVMFGLDAGGRNRAAAGPASQSMTILASVGASLFGDWKVTAAMLAMAMFGTVGSLPILVDWPTTTTERVVTTPVSETTGES